MLDATSQKAAETENRYKSQLAKYHQTKVKPRPLAKGDLVLWKNTVSRQEPQRKLDQTWEGPYIVKTCHGNGSYKLQDTEGQEIARTWNSSNLRKFYA